MLGFLATKSDAYEFKLKQKIPYISSKLVAMKLSTSLPFIVFLLLFRFTGAQNLQSIQSNPTSSFLPAFSMVDNDTLLVIEDASPELSPEGRKPLLLVHGWNFDGNPAPPGGNYWNNFLNYLKNDATLSANFKPYLVKYWSNSVSVKDLGAEFRSKVEAIGLNEQKIVILAHSMGGLVSRSYMNEQTFTTGSSAGEKCGDNVDLLITLSSPHHGSPMANGPARNAKVNVLLQATMNTVDALVFNETKYDDVNRTDLHWDNFDGLLDYNKYSDERNLWLEQLNQNTTYDSRTVCYSGSVDGQFIIPDASNLDEVYTLGSWFIEEGFGFTNDGIVPIQSSQFQGHTVKKVRYFKDYNHVNIILGKSDQETLFGPLKEDLMDVAPLRITWPTTAGNYLKHSQYRNIKWEAPSTVQHLNIYFSADNGNTFSELGSAVDATSGQFSWYIPDINSSDCLIKLEDADFPTTFSSSSNTFTIFHNKISVSIPSNPGYFVYNKNNTINWVQEGLGTKVKLIYADLEHGTEQVIAEDVDTQTGSNSYVWSSNATIVASTQAEIKVQLQHLKEDYGDSEIYTFASGNFQMLGDPNFTLLSPETSPVDFFGIEGEEVIVDEPYDIKWIAEGEIKFIEFYLCDTDKQIIQRISSDNNVPKVEVAGNTPTRMPLIYGNEFYLLAKAGLASDNILFEQYSAKSFRLNQKASILFPAGNDTTVSLQPCFELAQMKDAGSYAFYLQDTLATDQFPSWQYESATPQFCVPIKMENELQPGFTYQLTAVSTIDSIQSFADQVYFRTAAIAPWNFELLAPIEGDSTEEDQVQVVWTRSVGTNHYELLASQNGAIFFETSDLSPTDTTFTLPISDVEYYSTIQIDVSAVNSYGETSVSTAFYKHYKTDAPIALSPANIGITNYPNPVNSVSTFKILVPQGFDNSSLRLELFNLQGKKIETIAEGKFSAGSHTIVWQIKDAMKAGSYIYRLSMNGHSVSKMIMVQ